jgi:hypothetical protein
VDQFLGGRSHNPEKLGVDKLGVTLNQPIAKREDWMSRAGFIYKQMSHSM